MNEYESANLDEYDNANDDLDIGWMLHSAGFCVCDMVVLGGWSKYGEHSPCKEG